MELTLYVDEAENRCRNFNGRGLLGWKEKVVVTIDVVVASTPNFPQGESRSLDFDGDFRVNNRMTLTFDPILETDIDLSLARLRSARVEVKGRTSLDQVLTITADGAGALDKTHEIVPERKFIKVFLAGGVPVVISGQYSVDLRVQGNATGQIQATESVSLALEDMTYGLRFEGGTWSTTGQMRAVQSLKLVGEAQAEANLTLTLLPKVSISLYEVATARVALAPSLTAEGAIRGRVVEELVNTAATTDADAWLEKARLVTAIDAFVMAEFGAFDATLLTWPSGARAADYQTFQKIEVLTPQPILGIPILTAVADFSAKHPLDSSAILIRGTATNVPNPFRSLWGPDAFVEFSAWTVPRVIAANNEGYGFVSPPAGASPGDVWIRFTKPGSYTVRLGGHSTFGSWARQIAEQIVRFDDLNGNGILDFWEARYGGTDAAWAALDSDNDGRTNLEEWRAGTDPLVPDSAVSIVEVKDDIGGRQGSVANGGATDDPSPTLTGRLLAPLPVGSMIVVSDGNQTLGTANVSGLNWSFTPPPLVNGVHLLAAVLVQPSPALPISSPVWSISIGPDAPNAAAGGVSPTGVLETQCYREGTDVLIACGSAEAIALSGPGKQDGMRPGQFDFRVVGRSAGGSYDITDCVFDAITGLTWEGKPSGVGPRGADTSYTNFGDGQSGDAASYVTYVNSIALCGYRNWRLPTRQELAGLVDFGNTGSGTGNETTDPMINGTWFPNTKAGNHAYWTSTRSQQDDTGWIVRFGDGMVQRHSRLNAFFVRLVR